MKRLCILFLFIIISNSIFASNVSKKDVSNAFVAISDLGYVAASNFISFKRVDYDSIAIKMSQKNSLPEAILFNDADLHTFLQYFLINNKQNSFSSYFIPSIDPIVRERLLINDWDKGEAIVNGAAVIVFPNNMTFQKLISDGTSGIFPKVGVSYNYKVSGTLFSEEISIKGVFIFSSNEEGVPLITPLKLKINGEDYDLSIFDEAPLLLTMKNDI